MALAVGIALMAAMSKDSITTPDLLSWLPPSRLLPGEIRTYSEGDVSEAGRAVTGNASVSRGPETS